MALKIRLQRHGTSHRPFYRMVVTEANARRDGRFVELLGTYEPQASRPENELNLKIDRIDYWKSVGAKTTDTAESLLRRARREIDGVIPKAKSKKEKKKVEEAVEEAVEKRLKSLSLKLKKALQKLVLLLKRILLNLKHPMLQQKKLQKNLNLI